MTSRTQTKRKLAPTIAVACAVAFTAPSVDAREPHSDKQDTPPVEQASTDATSVAVPAYVTRIASRFPADVEAFAAITSLSATLLEPFDVSFAGNFDTILAMLELTPQRFNYRLDLAPTEFLTALSIDIESPAGAAISGNSFAMTFGVTDPVVAANGFATTCTAARLGPENSITRTIVGETTIIQTPYDAFAAVITNDSITFVWSWDDEFRDEVNAFAIELGSVGAGVSLAAEPSFVEAMASNSETTLAAWMPTSGIERLMREAGDAELPPLVRQAIAGIQTITLGAQFDGTQFESTVSVALEDSEQLGGLVNTALTSPDPANHDAAPANDFLETFGLSDTVDFEIELDDQRLQIHTRGQFDTSELHASLAAAAAEREREGAMLSALRRTFDGSVSAYIMSEDTPRHFPSSSGPMPSFDDLQAACVAGTDLDYSALATDPTFSALGFTGTESGQYVLVYESAGSGGASTFTATAYMDRDCDGVYATYTRIGFLVDGEIRGGPGIQIENEGE